MSFNRRLTSLPPCLIGMEACATAHYWARELRKLGHEIRLVPANTQFGEPVGAPVTTAGLKFKVPFIQDVNLIDKRVLEWDGNPSDMPTKDKLARSTSSPADGL